MIINQEHFAGIDREYCARQLAHSALSFARTIATPLSRDLQPGEESVPFTVALVIRDGSGKVLVLNRISGLSMTVIEQL